MTDIQAMASSIRFLALDAILNAREGHQGVPLGMAEIAATLYANHLCYDPTDPLWPDRDRVIVRCGFSRNIGFGDYSFSLRAS
jgi:transketolase